MAQLPPAPASLQFVRRYYEALKQGPDRALGYYGPSSHVLRTDRNVTLTAYNLLEIEALLQITRFTEIRFDSRVYAKAWYSVGVVVVHGSMMPINTTRLRKFKQTFFISYPEQYLVLDALVLSDDPYLRHTPLADPLTNLLPNKFARPPLAPAVYQDGFGAQQPAPGQAQVPRNVPQKRARENASLLSLEGNGGAVYFRNLEEMTEFLFNDGTTHSEKQSAFPYAGMCLNKNMHHPLISSKSGCRQMEDYLLKVFERFSRIKGAGFSSAFVPFEDIQSANNAIQASPLDLFGRKVNIQKGRIGRVSARGWE